MLTAERLRELLHYDENTGLFTWLARHHKIPAGAVAGTMSLGYRRIKIDGRSHLAHCLAWYYVHGTMPHCEVDHINCVRDDNRLHNLRLATRSENAQNMIRPKSNNTSGIRGVNWYARRETWRAYITLNGQTKHLGYFANMEDATAARKRAEEKYHPFRNNQSP